MTDTHLSPELALVDPALALAARASLPQPGSFRPGYLSLGSAPAAPPARLDAPAPAEALVAVPHRGRLVVAGGAAVLATIAIALLATLPALRSEPPTAPEPPTAAAPEPSAPQPGDVSYSNTWPEVPGAEVYDVSLTRGTTVVYRASTMSTSLELPAEIQLTPGTYTWTVTLPSDKPAAVEPSRPLVVTSFVVPARA